MSLRLENKNDHLELHHSNTLVGSAGAKIDIEISVKSVEPKQINANVLIPAGLFLNSLSKPIVKPIKQAAIDFKIKSLFKLNKISSI